MALTPTQKADHQQKCIALFDFDGTLTNKDSFFEFIRFALGIKKLILGGFLLFPILLQYKLGLLSNEKAKQIVFMHFFSGWDLNSFKSIATKFSLTVVPNLLKDTAVQQINWHKEQGHEVVVVSASFELYLKPWCDKNNISIIATLIEDRHECLTGKFLSPNCYGKEKVNRIKAEFNLAKFDFIYGYGDSPGDHEMLHLANESHYKYF